MAPLPIRIEDWDLSPTGPNFGDAIQAACRGIQEDYTRRGKPATIEVLKLGFAHAVGPVQLDPNLWRTVTNLDLSLQHLTNGAYVWGYDLAVIVPDQDREGGWSAVGLVPQGLPRRHNLCLVWTPEHWATATWKGKYLPSYIYSANLNEPLERWHRCKREAWALQKAGVPAIIGKENRKPGRPPASRAKSGDKSDERPLPGALPPVNPIPFVDPGPFGHQDLAIIFGRAANPALASVTGSHDSTLALQLDCVQGDTRGADLNLALDAVETMINNNKTSLKGSTDSLDPSLILRVHVVGRTATLEEQVQEQRVDHRKLEATVDKIGDLLRRLPRLVEFRWDTSILPPLPQVLREISKVGTQYTAIKFFFNLYKQEEQNQDFRRLLQDTTSASRSDKHEGIIRIHIEGAKMSETLAFLDFARLKFPTLWALNIWGHPGDTGVMSHSVEPTHDLKVTELKLSHVADYAPVLMQFDPKSIHVAHFIGEAPKVMSSINLEDMVHLRRLWVSFPGDTLGPFSKEDAESIHRESEAFAIYLRDKAPPLHELYVTGGRFPAPIDSILFQGVDKQLERGLNILGIVSPEVIFDNAALRRLGKSAQSLGTLHIVVKRALERGYPEALATIRALRCLRITPAPPTIPGPVDQVRRNGVRLAYLYATCQAAAQLAAWRERRRPRKMRRGPPKPGIEMVQWVETWEPPACRYKYVLEPAREGGTVAKARMVHFELDPRTRDGVVVEEDEVGR